MDAAGWSPESTRTQHRSEITSRFAADAKVGQFEVFDSHLRLRSEAFDRHSARSFCCNMRATTFNADVRSPLDLTETNDSFTNSPRKSPRSLELTNNILVHGQVTIIFVVSVGLSVCLFMQSFSQPSLIRFRSN